jgi:8-oxo-dGTP diphosphatase
MTLEVRGRLWTSKPTNQAIGRSRETSRTVTVMGDRLTRVSAYAVCVRAGTLLLVHQSAPGPARGRWTLPGGGVEFGESPTAAVRREVAEETSLDAIVHQLLGVHDDVYAGDDGVLRHGIRLLFRTDVRGTIRPAAGEIDDIGWHPLDRLPHSITDWDLLAASLALGTEPDAGDRRAG